MPNCGWSGDFGVRIEINAARVGSVPCSRVMVLSSCSVKGTGAEAGAEAGAGAGAVVVVGASCSNVTCMLMV